MRTTKRSPPPAAPAMRATLGRGDGVAPAAVEDDGDAVFDRRLDVLASVELGPMTVLVVESVDNCSCLTRSSGRRFSILEVTESASRTFFSEQPPEHGLLVQHPTNSAPDSQVYQVAPDGHEGTTSRFDQRMNMVVCCGPGCRVQGRPSKSILTWEPATL